MTSGSDRPSEQGVEMGAGEPTTFEPEEDPAAVAEPSSGHGPGHARTPGEERVDDEFGEADDPAR